jgi:hypothetical protein
MPIIGVIGGPVCDRQGGQGVQAGYESVYHLQRDANLPHLWCRPTGSCNQTLIQPQTPGVRT